MVCYAEPAGSPPHTDIAYTPSAATLSAWRSATAVCFDVDSTFCSDESIDEIAAFLGVGDAVATLTASAMGGTVTFQDALRDRLNLMQCSRPQMDAFLAAHPPQISPGIPELVQALQARGTSIYLVSGGFRVVIEPIADLMGIPRANVFANTLRWDEAGNYVGFDPEEFTSQSGGKARAVAHIRARDGHDVVVAMGDGATDVEARGEGAAAIFVGYGGVVMREGVARAADWYVTSFEPLVAALK